MPAAVRRVTSRHLVEYGAQSIGLLPLAWLSLRREREAHRWLLASAFAASWVADAVAHQWDAVALLSLVYPVGQAALIGMALLPAREASGFVLTLVLAGIAAVFVHRTGQPDLFLHTVAWGAVCGLAAREMRGALLTYFGLGLLAYYALVVWRTDLAWYAYQSTRLVGVSAFCWAATRKADQ